MNEGEEGESGENEREDDLIGNLHIEKIVDAESNGDESA